MKNLKAFLLYVAKSLWITVLTIVGGIIITVVAAYILSEHLGIL